MQLTLHAIAGAAVAVGATVGLHFVSHAPLPSPDGFMKGMTDAGYSANVFATPVSDASIRALRRTGTRWLAVQTMWFQTTDQSADIAPTMQTPTDASIIHLIRLARSLGMRIFLNPFVNAEQGSAWQADFHPLSWPKWFAAYQKCIVHYAALAQAEHVELLAIGDENDSSDTVPALYPQYRQLIKAVRAVYHGKVIYGADWPNYTKVTFWPLLDDIGIDAYFPLAQPGQTPTAPVLEASWQREAASIASWRSSTHLWKPVVITELGYPSEVGAAQDPGFWLPGRPVDLALQTALYQATFDTVYRKPWLRGIFWFWWLNPSDEGWPGGPQDNGYGVQGKPVLAVLQHYFMAPR